MVRQRVFGIALDYEDLNDHADRCHHPGFQTATGRDRALASAPTLCRFENRPERHRARAIHAVLVESLIAAFAQLPEEIVRDTGATDDAVHGDQGGASSAGHDDGTAIGNSGARPGTPQNLPDSVIPEDS